MKRMMMGFALALGLLCVSPGVVAPLRAADMSLVQQRVARVEVLRGDFQQEKRIAGFRNPLKSQGRFVVSRTRGVIWSTLKPFPSEVVVTRDRILSRQADGSQRVEVDARQQPALRSVNEMMFALVGGDVATLSSRFDIRVDEMAGNGWKLTLSPRAAALKQAFTRITLTGDRYVRNVAIEEANGDRTLLGFSAISEAPATLSTDEAKRFD